MKSYFSLACRLGLGVIAAAVIFALITCYALESREVVVLHSYDETGREYASRVWIADEQGRAWIEAASADKPFYLRLLASGRVDLTRAGERRSYRALARPGAKGHQHIRRLLAAKYGWADVWVSMFVDTSASVAVRLERIDEDR